MFGVWDLQMICKFRVVVMYDIVDADACKTVFVECVGECAAGTVAGSSNLRSVVTLPGNWNRTSHKMGSGFMGVFELGLHSVLYI